MWVMEGKAKDRLHTLYALTDAEQKRDYLSKSSQILEFIFARSLIRNELPCSGKYCLHLQADQFMDTITE
jgi:hypothetical protein